ncbi:hypothetical protein HK405_015528, partial [Cladochytrium tenue]
TSPIEPDDLALSAGSGSPPTAASAEHDDVDGDGVGDNAADDAVPPLFAAATDTAVAPGCDDDDLLQPLPELPLPADAEAAADSQSPMDSPEIATAAAPAPAPSLSPVSSSSSPSPSSPAHRLDSGRGPCLDPLIEVVADQDIPAVAATELAPATSPQPSSTIALEKVPPSQPSQDSDDVGRPMEDNVPARRTGSADNGETSPSEPADDGPAGEGLSLDTDCSTAANLTPVAKEWSAAAVIDDDDEVDDDDDDSPTANTADAVDPGQVSPHDAPGVGFDIDTNGATVVSVEPSVNLCDAAADHTVLQDLPLAESRQLSVDSASPLPSLQPLTQTDDQPISALLAPAAPDVEAVDSLESSPDLMGATSPLPETSLPETSPSLLPTADVSPLEPATALTLSPPASPVPSPVAAATATAAAATSDSLITSSPSSSPPPSPPSRLSLGPTSSPVLPASHSPPLFRPGALLPPPSPIRPDRAAVVDPADFAEDPVLFDLDLDID